MSGTALTMVSPSRVRMRRRVVCVAGCWGPKLRVQRKSFSAPSGGAVASASWSGMAASVGVGSALGPGQGGAVVPLAVARQWVVLAEREARRLLVSQDAPQVA